MGSTLYGTSIAGTATASLTAGAADASFPITNVNNARPDQPFKATGLTCTIRLTWGAAVNVQLVGIIHHNRPGTSVTLGSSGGLATTLSLPALGDDSYPVNGFKDVRGLSGTTGITTLDLAIPTGSGNVAIGEVVVLAVASTMLPLWGLKHGDDHPVIHHLTEFDVDLIYDKGYRQRTYVAEIARESERAAITALHRTCKGMVTPFAFVLDSAVNDLALVRFKTTALPWTREHPRVSRATLELKEVSAGLAF
jgi:hypothetical protein